VLRIEGELGENAWIQLNNHKEKKMLIDMSGGFEIQNKKASANQILELAKMHEDGKALNQEQIKALSHATSEVLKTAADLNQNKTKSMRAMGLGAIGAMFALCIGDQRFAPVEKTVSNAEKIKDLCLRSSEAESYRQEVLARRELIELDLTIINFLYEKEIKASLEKQWRGAATQLLDANSESSRKTEMLERQSKR
jgi:hypothetical protein